MKNFLTILVLAVLFAMLLPGEACSKSIKAYFNGQEATVSDIVLSPGEPFEVDLVIRPDSEAYVFAEIDEPGVTRAYDLLSGDPLMPTKAKTCNASSPASYHWEMAANGNWVDGNAPVNIYYQVNIPGKSEVLFRGYFTVADAYIVPGDLYVSTLDDTSDKNSGKTPGPSIITTIAGIGAALLIRGAGRRCREVCEGFSESI